MIRSQTFLRFAVSSFAVLLAGALPATAAPNSAGNIKFAGASFPVAEEAGVVVLRVKRQQGSTGEVSVDWETTSGTATDGEDYISASGTLTWPDGDRSDRTFEIEILDDDIEEPQEIFGVELSEPTGGAALKPPSTALVRIKPSDQSDDDDDGDDDDEEEDAGIIKLSNATTPVFESDGVAVVEVERADGSNGPATVDYVTIEGSATEGDDYSFVTGTLNWADGAEGTRTFEIPIVDDEESEDLETITVVLTNATGAELGVRDVGSVIIVDDDGGSGSCLPDDETLCLRDGRFQVTGTWTDFVGATGSIHWIPATDGTGLGWFFSDDNVELLLKVLDGCGLNSHYWVFYAATSNVGFELEVTDLETGDVQTYTNPLGEVATAVTDVFAFDTCE